MKLMRERSRQKKLYLVDRFEQLMRFHQILDEQRENDQQEGITVLKNFDESKKSKKIIFKNFVQTIIKDTRKREGASNLEFEIAKQKSTKK